MRPVKPFVTAAVIKGQHKQSALDLRIANTVAKRRGERKYQLAIREDKRRRRCVSVSGDALPEAAPRGCNRIRAECLSAPSAETERHCAPMMCLWQAPPRAHTPRHAWDAYFTHAYTRYLHAIHAYVQACVRGHTCIIH
jgi:hypothetical protein